jgi:archaellin
MLPELILVPTAVLLCVLLPAGAYTQAGACCTVTQQVKDQVSTALQQTCWPGRHIMHSG